MLKKFLSAVIMTCLVTFFAGVCSAGTFQTIYKAEYFTDEMKSNESASETFNTNDGTIKFQLRKLWTEDKSKMMHITAALNDKRIYDQHFPQITYGYTFRVIKNTADNRQFYVIQSVERALLIGYSASSGKMETYIDSFNYYHNFQAYPYIVTTKSGDLILAFEEYGAGDRTPRRVRYLFTWDNSKNWFAYRSLGDYSYSVSRDMQ